MAIAAVGRTLAGLLKSTGPAAGIGVGIGAGSAAGGSAVSVAMMPFNAVNNFLGSGFFGYGMIMGERYAYQNDWPKIQKRLEGGEDIFNIMHEYTGRFSAVMMAEAKIIMQDVSTFVHDLMSSFASGDTDKKAASTAGIQWFINMMNEQNNPNFVGPPTNKETDFITGATIDDRNIEAAEKERLRQIQARKDEQKRILNNQQDTNKQIDQIIISQPTVKRKAGQSQIIHRNNLIRMLKQESDRWSFYKRELVNGKNLSPAQRTSLIATIDKWQKQVQKRQLELSAFLVKYTW